MRGETLFETIKRVQIDTFPDSYWALTEIDWKKKVLRVTHSWKDNITFLQKKRKKIASFAWVSRKEVKLVHTHGSHVSDAKTHLQRIYHRKKNEEGFSSLVTATIFSFSRPGTAKGRQDRLCACVCFFQTTTVTGYSLPEVDFEWETLDTS